jgi:tight adherence protein C
MAVEYGHHVAVPFLLLISGIITAGVAFVWIGVRQLYQAPSIRDRFAKYVVISQTPDEMELQQPLSERVLKPLFRRVLQWLGQLTPTGNMEEISRRLIIAGRPGNLSAIDFVGLKLLSSLCIGSLAALYFFSRDLPAMAALLFSIAGALTGQLLPSLWLKHVIKRRKALILKILPDALDMLSICVDAGLGFDAALLKVAEKWDNPLSREFSRVVSEIRMGIRRIEALRHMAERVDVPEVHSFVAVLIQADRLGVSIAEILHVQSEQLRMRRRQWAEEQARKAPTKMLFPLILFIFPALFVVILGPAVPRFIEAFAHMR